MLEPRKRDHKEEGKPINRLFSFVYFIAVIIIAYFLSGLALDQAEQNDMLDLDDIELPMVNQKVPPLAIQLVLAVVIFFIIQFFSVFIISLFRGGDPDVYDPDKDQWGRR